MPATPQRRVHQIKKNGVHQITTRVPNHDKELRFRHPEWSEGPVAQDLVAETKKPRGYRGFLKSLHVL